MPCRCRRPTSDVARHPSQDSKPRSRSSAIDTTFLTASPSRPATLCLRLATCRRRIGSGRCSGAGGPRRVGWQRSPAPKPCRSTASAELWDSAGPPMPPGTRRPLPSENSFGRSSRVSTRRSRARQGPSKPRCSAIGLVPGRRPTASPGASCSPVCSPPPGNSS